MKNNFIGYVILIWSGGTIEQFDDLQLDTKIVVKQGNSN